MKRIRGRANRVGYRRLRQTRAAPKNTVVGAGDADTATGKAPGWWSRQRDEFLRDTLVAGLCGIILLRFAVWFDDRREDRAQDLANQQALRAEVLENTRFVRQAVMDPTVTVKPFRGLNLRGAHLASLSLGCPKGVEPGDIFSGCADLTEANLNNANLNNADLIGADLIGADLTSANLTDADLISADLTSADLTSVDLNGADLAGAKLTYAQLNGADLRDADLNGADLSNAQLNNAQLNGADLRNAQLNNAQLHNAQLNNADLNNADLTGVCYDVRTVWPKRFETPQGSDCLTGMHLAARGCTPPWLGCRQGSERPS